MGVWIHSAQDNLGSELFQRISLDSANLFKGVLVKNEYLFPVAIFYGVKRVCEQRLAEMKIDNRSGHDSTDFVMWINKIDHDILRLPVARATVSIFMNEVIGSMICPYYI